MLVMVLAETFHKTYERGLFGKVPQNLKKNNCNKTLKLWDRPFKVQLQLHHWNKIVY